MSTDTPDAPDGGGGGVVDIGAPVGGGGVVDIGAPAGGGVTAIGSAVGGLVGGDGCDSNGGVMLAVGGLVGGDGGRSVASLLGSWVLIPSPRG